MAGVYDVSAGETDEFPARVSVELARSGVRVHDAAFYVEEQERVHVRVEDGSVSLLALVKRVLGMLPRRDVESHAQYLRDISLFAQYEFVSPGYPYPLAVLAHVLVHVGLVALGMSQDIGDHCAKVTPGRLRLRHYRADDVPADDLSLSVTEEALAELVEETDCAVAAPAQYYAVGILDQLAVSLL